MPPITMYTSGYCPYCNMAERLLKSRGVTAIEKVRVDADPAQMSAMLVRSHGRRSVPQIFIGDTHIGGFDDLAALDRAGGLVPLLQGTPPAA